jgi:hypothetical protein
LRLVPGFRFGRLLTGILLASILLPLFYLGATEDPSDSTPALFFSLIIAYIIPVFSLITATTEEALAELRPILDLDAATFEETRSKLHSSSLRQTSLCLGIGALCGFAHMSLIRGSVAATFQQMWITLSGFMSTLGTLLVWMIMTTVITMLIRQTILFSRLGANHVRISLPATRKLLPFARVSIISSLAVIGALALFPLIGIESGLNLVESVPGAVAMLVPLVIMFITPVWPIHQRLAALKERELLAVNNRIDLCLSGRDTVELEDSEIRQLTLLLTFRREITHIPTWPFDMGNLTRLTLYLVIVPLTWAGAALIENLVDYLL